METTHSRDTLSLVQRGGDRVKREPGAFRGERRRPSESPSQPPPARTDHWVTAAPRGKSVKLPLFSGPGRPSLRPGPEVVLRPQEISQVHWQVGQFLLSFAQWGNRTRRSLWGKAGQ